MYPHRIRLRGPWQREPLAGFAGRVRFRRRFGYPGRIDDYERVWLTFAAVVGSAEVQLNGQPLGRFEGGDAEFDVTTLLRARNEVIVEVESSAEVCGEVALEVRCTAYLRNVRFEGVTEGDSLRLRVRGEVVGTNERQLELYALAGRSTVAYATVEATPSGQPFEMLGDPIPQKHEKELPVRVELVNGGCVWFVVEGRL
jgi:hypothetical protein